MPVIVNKLEIEIDERFKKERDDSANGLEVDSKEAGLLVNANSRQQGLQRLEDETSYVSSMTCSHSEFDR